MTDQVYVMHMSNTNYYKIGYSNNPEKRLKTLQIGSPELLTLYTVIDPKPLCDAQSLEGRLHKYFAAYNTRSEWFKFSNVEELEKGLDHFLTLIEDKKRDELTKFMLKQEKLKSEMNIIIKYIKAFKNIYDVYMLNTKNNHILVEDNLNNLDNIIRDYKQHRAYIKKYMTSYSFIDKKWPEALYRNFQGGFVNFIEEVLYCYSDSNICLDHLKTNWDNKGLNRELGYFIHPSSYTPHF